MEPVHLINAMQNSISRTSTELVLSEPADDVLNRECWEVPNGLYGGIIGSRGSEGMHMEPPNVHGLKRVLRLSSLEMNHLFRLPGP